MVIGRIGGEGGRHGHGDIHTDIVNLVRALAHLTRVFSLINVGDMREQNPPAAGKPYEPAPAVRAQTGPMSIEVATDAWQQHSAVFLGISEYQARRGRDEIRRMAKSCGWAMAEQFDRSALTDWIVQQIAAKSISRVTAGKLLSYWSVFGDWLVERGQWTENRVRGIKLPRIKAKDRGPGARAFSVEEVRALIEAAQHMEQTSGRAGKYGPNRSTLYLFLAHTGLRYGEATRLEWKVIDLANRRLRVRDDKAGRGDHIPIHDEVCEALAELRAANPADSRVFRKVSHHTLTADMERAKVARRVDGQGGQWHCFRKMSVTERLRRGADPDHVRRLARHQNLSLTMGTYNQLAGEELRGAVEKIPRLMGEMFLQPGGKDDSVTSSRHANPSPHPDSAPRPEPSDAWRDNSANAGRAALSGRGDASPADFDLSAKQWSRGESTARSHSSPTAELLEAVSLLLSATAKVMRGRSLEHEHIQQRHNQRTV